MQLQCTVCGEGALFQVERTIVRDNEAVTLVLSNRLDDPDASERDEHRVTLSVAEGGILSVTLAHVA